MSFTQGEEVFAGVHESALNDLVTAFFTDRPRYLTYGSPGFAPATTVSETRIQAIPFPFVPGGIQWRVRLKVPKLDLFEQDDALPPELILGPGQFSGSVEVELCVDCQRSRPESDDPSSIDPRDDNPNDPDGPPIVENATCFSLRVFFTGRLVRAPEPGGVDAVSLAVDQIEIVDIRPDELESFLECLLFLIIRGVLAEVRLPLEALRLGAFELTPTVGPLIEDNQVKMRGMF